jgi:hypothetical protein
MYTFWANLHFWLGYCPVRKSEDPLTGWCVLLRAPIAPAVALLGSAAYDAPLCKREHRHKTLSFA